MNVINSTDNIIRVSVKQADSFKPTTIKIVDYSD